MSEPDAGPLPLPGMDSELDSKDHSAPIVPAGACWTATQLDQIRRADKENNEKLRVYVGRVLTSATTETKAMSYEVVNAAESAGKENSRNPAEHLAAYKWKRGQSGNPSGRPKKKWLTEAYEEMLERKLSDPVERMAFIEAQWQKLNSKGVVSTMLLEKVLDRTEGKLTQPVDVSGEIDIVTIIEEGRKRLG